MKTWGDPEDIFTPKQLRHRAWRYGLTIAELLEVMRRNGGACAIHGRPMPPDSMVIDHCHTTGKVRDYICRSCNMEVGWIEQGRTDIYRPFSEKALAYVARWSSEVAA
jgi:hypothetical protein